jgi:hypothetical protein
VDIRSGGVKCILRATSSFPLCSSGHFMSEGRQSPWNNPLTYPTTVILWLLFVTLSKSGLKPE